MPLRLPSPLFCGAAFAGSWIAAAALVVGSTLFLEMLSASPLHRNDFEGARPFVESRTVLSRLGVWLRVPGQRLRFAEALRDLAEIQMWSGELERAEASYLESIALFESGLGAQSAEARNARWRYADFSRRRAESSRRP